MKVELKNFKNDFYQPGSPVRRITWYYINALFFKTDLFPFYALKRTLLKIFGAKIGVGVVIKPDVNIKYPWFLEIGDYSWIGEGVWIDCLAKVTIGANVSISQGAYLLTGNHNYKKPAFDLMVSGINIEDGVWIGAKSIVCPGINCRENSILTVGSIATKDLEMNGIYQGNPAVKIKERIINISIQKGV